MIFWLILVENENRIYERLNNVKFLHKQTLIFILSLPVSQNKKKAAFFRSVFSIGNPKDGVVRAAYEKYNAAPVTPP
jgi:hypothetical protein